VLSEEEHLAQKYINSFGISKQQTRPSDSSQLLAGLSHSQLHHCSVNGSDHSRDAVLTQRFILATEMLCGYLAEQIFS
jgi:hypothetical protein